MHHTAKALKNFICMLTINSSMIILMSCRIIVAYGAIWGNILTTVCYYHVTYEFQSESTFNSLPECQGTPCSKQAPYLKFKRQQRDSNPKPLSS